MTTDDFISAQEVSDFLRLDLATVYELARVGALPGAIWGEVLRFDLKDLKTGMGGSCMAVLGRRSDDLRNKAL
jgi:hypothetical protein